MPHASHGKMWKRGRSESLKIESTKLHKDGSAAARKREGMEFRKLVMITLLLFSASFLFCFPAFALTNKEIASYQREIADRPIGERIALWSEKFIGAAYDPDPLGEYVRKSVIVADERVDCMYLSFRAVELALGHTPEESILIALDKRFINKGVLEGGRVINYEDRFQYGEDMLDSRKWGREITGDIGPVTSVKGSRGRASVGMISKDALQEQIKKWGREPVLKDGDLVFFVKYPDKRVVGEIIGHIGVIKIEKGIPYLIHAGGRKNNGGEVKKILFYDYVSSMPFAGVRVSRFP